VRQRSTRRKVVAPIPVPVDPGNAPPVMTPLSDQTAHPGIQLLFQAMGSDGSDDMLTFSLVGGPSGAAVSPDGQFTWTPLWSQLGAWTVVLRVTDSGGLSDTQSCTVSVENQAPVLNPLPDQTAHPGTQVTFPVSAFDPDDDPLTYSLVDGPPGAMIAGAQFTWTPTWSQLGAWTVTVQVTDSGGLSDTQSCTISVENQPPVLSPLPDQTAHPGTQVAFPLSAFDPDDDALTYSLDSGPPGASVAGGQFTWTPTWSQLGAWTVVVRVTDAGGLSDTQSCTITVENQAPTLGAISDQEVNAGDTLTVPLMAFDPDDDPLTYSLDSGPPGAAVNGGQFTWTPTADQVGAWTVVVRVTDPGGLASVRSFTVTVD
jgi:hypothetical protein